LADENYRIIMIEFWFMDTFMDPQRVQGPQGGLFSSLLSFRNILVNTRQYYQSIYIHFTQKSVTFRIRNRGSYKFVRMNGFRSPYGKSLPVCPWLKALGAVAEFMWGDDGEN